MNELAQKFCRHIFRSVSIVQALSSAYLPHTELLGLSVCLCYVLRAAFTHLLYGIRAHAGRRASLGNEANLCIPEKRLSHVIIYFGIFINLSADPDVFGCDVISGE